jgi:hypothetical protein
MTRVQVHIARLVLKGLRHESRHAVGEALRAELARLLAQPDAMAQMTALGDGAALLKVRARLAADASPRQTGAAVARAIAGGAKR